MGENILIIGDRFEGVLLETFIGKSASRPRVRPLEYFETDIVVKFPSQLRIDNPIGTRFRADVKVCQKTKNNQPFGRPYLDSTDSSIVKLDYLPYKIIKAIKLDTISERAYRYIEQEFHKEPRLIKFSDFREKAYQNSIESPKEILTNASSASNRLDIIRTYALSRARGKCESCENDAPFLKRNGQPYLEVHHIIELSKGGSDSPKNVAAICPNCHANISYGVDAISLNKKLEYKIKQLEKNMDE
jgi:hypothetical protein